MFFQIPWTSNSKQHSIFRFRAWNKIFEKGILAVKGEGLNMANAGA